MRKMRIDLLILSLVVLGIAVGVSKVEAGWASYSNGDYPANASFFCKVNYYGQVYVGKLRPTARDSRDPRFFIYPGCVISVSDRDEIVPQYEVETPNGWLPAQNGHVPARATYFCKHIHPQTGQEYPGRLRPGSRGCLIGDQIFSTYLVEVPSGASPPRQPNPGMAPPDRTAPPVRPAQPRMSQTDVVFAEIRKVRGGPRTHLYDSIPRHKLTNAHNLYLDYSGAPAGVLLLHDATEGGGGGNGFCLTASGIWWRYEMSNHHLKYDQIRTVNAMKTAVLGNPILKINDQKISVWGNAERFRDLLNGIKLALQRAGYIRR